MALRVAAGPVDGALAPADDVPQADTLPEAAEFDGGVRRHRAGADATGPGVLRGFSAPPLAANGSNRFAALGTGQAGAGRLSGVLRRLARAGDQHAIHA